MNNHENMHEKYLLFCVSATPQEWALPEIGHINNKKIKNSAQKDVEKI